jgi:Flp pilus assembly protein TadD
VLLACVFAVIGGGAATLLNREPAREPPPSAITLKIPEWKATLGAITGTATEHSARGRKLFLEHRPESYTKAEVAFLSAVVLNAADIRSLSHYVSTVTVGRGEWLSPEELAEVRDLASAALDAAPRMAAAHRARANVLLASGKPDLARGRAEEALKYAEAAGNVEEKVEALVTLGESVLQNSAPLAREKLEAALAIDSTHRRAAFLRGVSAERAGRAAQAKADYEALLALDSGQGSAVGALSRLHAARGDSREAQRVLERYLPDLAAPGARLLRAAYVLRGVQKKLEPALKRLNDDFAALTPAERVQFLSLAAAAARARGNLSAATENATAALALRPRDGPAHFQLLLTSLDRKRVREAREHLEACAAHLEPSRVEEYRGRIELAAGAPDRAIDSFQKAASLAPSRLFPLLAAAATHAKMGHEDVAYQLMHKSLELDPTPIARLRSSPGEFHEPALGALKPLAGAFDGLKDPDRLWLPQTYASVLRYHLGDTDRAARGLDEGLRNDGTSLPALLYRARIELDRKHFEAALSFAARAKEAARASAIAPYLEALALEGLGKTEDAQRAYAQALARAPNLVAANLRRGLLAREEGDLEDAKDRLLKVVGIEPDNVEARIALYELGH